MKFAEKNDNGIMLLLTPEERELLFNALRYYHAYGVHRQYIMEQTENICGILNVLHLPEFDRRGIEK